MEERITVKEFYVNFFVTYCNVFDVKRPDGRAMRGMRPFRSSVAICKLKQIKSIVDPSLHFVHWYGELTVRVKAPGSTGSKVLRLYLHQKMEEFIIPKTVCLVILPVITLCRA